MSSDPKKLGTETRSSILPTTLSVDEMLGPNYDFSDELKMPNEVGVKRGSSLGSVIDAARGVAYYSDMIGYGNPSSSFTRGMKEKPKPMGINYFVRSPTKCSNGADMWIYVAGIPEGTIFGKKIRDAMKGMGIPALQGLAPGMIEDVKAGLDPRGVANAIFGSGYMQCKQVEMPVGDVNGKLKGNDGQEWIRSLFPGDIKYKGKRPYQTRWVFDRWLTQEEYTTQYAARAFCPDGSRIANHADKDCAKPLLKKEGFQTNMFNRDEPIDGLLPVALLIGIGAVLYMRYRNQANA